MVGAGCVKTSLKPCPGSAVLQTPLPESAPRAGVSLVAVELKDSGAFVMIQQRLCSAAAEAE